MLWPRARTTARSAARHVRTKVARSGSVQGWCSLWFSPSRCGWIESSNEDRGGWSLLVPERGEPSLVVGRYRKQGTAFVADVGVECVPAFVEGLLDRDETGAGVGLPGREEQPCLAVSVMVPAQVVGEATAEHAGTQGILRSGQPDVGILRDDRVSVGSACGKVRQVVLMPAAQGCTVGQASAHGLFPFFRLQGEPVVEQHTNPAYDHVGATVHPFPTGFGVGGQNLYVEHGLGRVW